MLGRLNKVVEMEVTDLTPYHKGGFDAQVRMPVSAGDWPERVVSVIGLAQEFGRGWEITNHIDDGLDMTTTEFSVTGLTFAWLTLVK